ncbi:MAG: magnesium transporter [Deltaproteobacteria bacterium]|jgi:magnesium transporter|nr:magnesium transporter [Deltaproteobacteria bacterium]MDP7462878.1 magnesium transporter [SAR324 cluster bacterium]
MAKTRDPQYHRLVKKLINTERSQVLKSLLNSLSPNEVSGILLHLNLKHQLAILDLLEQEQVPLVLKELQDSSTVLEEIVGQFSSDKLTDIVEGMKQDDAADLVSILDESQVDAVMENLPAKSREELTTLLQYDEESAGGLMTPHVVSIVKDETVGEAVKDIQGYIKRQGFQMFYTAYVVDEHRHLIGTVTVTELLLADRRAKIGNLMNFDVVAVDEDLDQEEVVRIAKEYDLVVVPVIDKHLKLIGRITIDDLVDVMEEEYYEDIGHIAGTGAEEVTEPSVLRASRDRLPWLVLGLLGGFLTAIVMNSYENAILRIPEVAYFIPLIAAIGGSIGIQSSSIVVRGLATGAIQTTDLLVRLWKELRVGFLNGVVCAALLVLMTLYLTEDLQMAITTGLALVVVVCFAAAVGSSVPILLKRLNIDPALAVGPFITTTNDIFGIAIYLAITFSAPFQSFSI